MKKNNIVGALGRLQATIVDFEARFGVLLEENIKEAFLTRSKMLCMLGGSTKSTLA